MYTWDHHSWFLGAIKFTKAGIVVPRNEPSHHEASSGGRVGIGYTFSAPRTDRREFSLGMSRLVIIRRLRRLPISKLSDKYWVVPIDGRFSEIPRKNLQQLGCLFHFHCSETSNLFYVHCQSWDIYYMEIELHTFGLAIERRDSRHKPIKSRRHEHAARAKAIRGAGWALDRVRSRDTRFEYSSLLTPQASHRWRKFSNRLQEFWKSALPIHSLRKMRVIK
jgi:hypothetical protein